MRVAVLGGTGFIGRAIAAEVAAAGHDVLVVHRGRREPGADRGHPVVEHAHVDRHDVPALRAAIEVFGADASIDGLAMTARDADDALAAVPDGMRLVVLSSMDVYRAFAALHTGGESDPMPLDESSPVREQRYPYRGTMPGADDYEKLDVEERFLARGGTVLRLPMVYGEHDPQRREEPVLRRIRAGRTRIPVGTGTWLWTRSYVGEVARAARLAVECGAAAGEIVNVGEAKTGTMRAWLEAIVMAAGADVELVQVPDHLLPDDLKLTGSIRQHLLFDMAKARALLGFMHADPREGIGRSVRWHLAHPPSEPDLDFEADDRALEAARPPAPA